MKAVPVSFIGFVYFFISVNPTYAQKTDSLEKGNLKDQRNFISNTNLSQGDQSQNVKTGATYLSGKEKASDSSFTYAYSFRNEEAPLRTKLWRGEKMIGGAEVAGMGILILLPKKVTKWQDDWMADAMRNLKRSWTHMPVWDHDNWEFNYAGHPIAGSYYYNAIRSQNASMFSSFAFAAFQSTLWEYVVEGIAERPSIQDLFVTPIGGAIVGELTHRATLRMQRGGFSFFEKAFVLVFNPMYAINNGFKKKYRRIPLYN